MRGRPRHPQAPSGAWHSGVVTVLRRLFLVAAWLCALGGTAFVLLYVMPELQSASRLVAMASAFIPYGIVLWLVALLGFVVGHTGRGRLLGVVALIALLLQIAWARPYWPHGGAPAEGARLRVMSSNVLYGRADPASAAAALRSADADVVVLLEVSETFLTSPEVAEALASYPHRVGRATPAGVQNAAPTMVLSRTPLTEMAQLISGFDQYVVRVNVGGTPVTLVAAHPLNMVGGGTRWEREGLILRDGVRPYLGDPLVIAGDLNAVPEHLTLRRLLAEGLTLAAQQAGAGWQPTFAGELHDAPPLIAIDHVLVNERVTATSYRTIRIKDTDHHAVVADLVVR